MIKSPFVIITFEDEQLNKSQRIKRVQYAIVHLHTKYGKKIALLLSYGPYCKYIRPWLFVIQGNLLKNKGHNSEKNFKQCQKKVHSRLHTSNKI